MVYRYFYDCEFIEDGRLIDLVSIGVVDEQGREFYAVGELTTAFFVADVLEDFAATGEIEFDPVWTTVFVAGALFFLVMWTLKKTGRLRV